MLSERKKKKFSEFQNFKIKIQFEFELLIIQNVVLLNIIKMI